MCLLTSEVKEMLKKEKENYLLQEVMVFPAPVPPVWPTTPIVREMKGWNGAASQSQKSQPPAVQEKILSATPAGNPPFTLMSIGKSTCAKCVLFFRGSVEMAFDPLKSTSILLYI